MAANYTQSGIGRTYALRMILLGEAGAGKTCLFHWIKYKVFRDASINTGPVPSSTSTSRQRQYDQHMMHINVSPSIKIVLTVVDTTDGEKFQSLTAHYYRRANIVLLVCSLDDEVTLTRLTKWYRDSLYYIDEHDTIYGVCGLKSDLPDQRKEVTLEMMQRFARHVEFPENCVFEVSAKMGEGVKDMLITLCSTAIEKIRRNTPNRDSVLNTEETSMLLITNHDGSHDGNGSLNSDVKSRNKCCECVIL